MKFSRFLCAALAVGLAVAPVTAVVKDGVWVPVSVELNKVEAKGVFFKLLFKPFLESAPSVGDDLGRSLFKPVPEAELMPGPYRFDWNQLDNALKEEYFGVAPQRVEPSLTPDQIKARKVRRARRDLASALRIYADDRGVARLYNRSRSGVGEADVARVTATLIQVAEHSDRARSRLRKSLNRLKPEQRRDVLGEAVFERLQRESGWIAQAYEDGFKVCSSRESIESNLESAFEGYQFWNELAGAPVETLQSWAEGKVKSRLEEYVGERSGYVRGFRALQERIGEYVSVSLSDDMKVMTVTFDPPCGIKDLEPWDVALKPASGKKFVGIDAADTARM